MLKKLGINIEGDRFIWGIVVLLSLVSLLAVYSSTGTLAYKMKGGNTEYYLIKHLVLMLGGLGLMYYCHKIDYRYFSKVSVVMLMVTIPLLFLTLFMGTNINSASRWLTLPILNISFQTSDLAKLALTMYLARSLSKMQSEEQEFVNTFLVRQMGPIFVVCGLIAPADLSTAAMIFMTSVLLLFIGRVKINYLLRLLGVMIVFLVMFFSVILNHKALGLEGVGRISTWNARIHSFTEGSEDGGSYQTKQAKIAIATGGLVFGKGPGNSQQRNFLPHPYSDFIYAIILEEYGLLFGGVVLIVLYLLFLLRCIKIVVHAPKAFGALLAVGLSFSLVIQAMLNMAVTVNLLPVTGLPLPLVSMGGTSIWFTSISIGLILSVSKSVEEQSIANE